MQDYTNDIIHIRRDLNDEWKKKICSELLSVNPSRKQG